MEDFKYLFRTMPEELYKRFMGLWNVPQRPDYHPEGNTLKHSIIVLQRTLYFFPYNRDLHLASIFHDIGKDVTLRYNEATGMPTAYGHEDISANIVLDYQDWIRYWLGNPDKVEWIVRNHMRIKKINEMTDKKRQQLIDHPFYSDLINFSSMDVGGYFN